MKITHIIPGALAVGAVLISTGLTASAEHRSGIAYAVDSIERSTDHLFTHYKKELQSRGLWKPRGAYSTLYSATFRMEEYGDAMKKYYGRRASLTTLGRMASNIDHQLVIAENVARHLRLSRGIHADIAAVRAAVHSISGYCAGHDSGYSARGDRDNSRVYRNDRSGYRNDRVYRDDRVLRDNRGYRDDDRVYRDRRRAPSTYDRDYRSNSSNHRSARPENQIHQEVQRWIGRLY